MVKVGIIMGSKSDLPVMKEAIDILKNNNSITGRYLSHKEFIQIPKKRRLAKNGRFLEINGASNSSPL